MMEPAQLASLLSGCCEADDASWKEFMRVFHPLIRGTVRKCGVDHIDDVVQLVYLEFIRSNYNLLRRFQGSYPAFLIYIQRTARNVAMSQYRAGATHSSRNMDVDSALDRLADPSPAPEDLLVSRETLDRCRNAIDSLRPSYREIVMHLYNGLNHREVAEMLKIPIGTVLTRASRAKEILRRQIKIEIS